jgi:hypothetical protein
MLYTILERNEPNNMSLVGLRDILNTDRKSSKHEAHNAYAYH